MCATFFPVTSLHLCRPYIASYQGLLPNKLADLGKTNHWKGGEIDKHSNPVLHFINPKLLPVKISTYKQKYTGT